MVTARDGSRLARRSRARAGAASLLSRLSHVAPGTLAQGLFSICEDPRGRMRAPMQTSVDLDL